ncbi:MAG: Bug family tripartite tricarboxylate transporter substrate binding protein [Candidatus Binatia bacterium]
MDRRQRFKVTLGFLFSVAIFSWMVAGSATSAEAAVSFAGKSIRILIGYPPGGGHDLEARVIARHLAKYLPGKPSIIVQNMPGAGGMIQAAYIYNRAKPNGLTFALFGSSHGIQALLLKGENIKYNLAKMPVIWAVGGVTIDLVRDFLNARKAKELLKVDPRKIVVAGRSKGGSSCTRGQLALQLLGIKGYKAVCAYKGTSPIRGAMERGEVSFFTASAAHLIGSGAFVDLHQRGLVYPMWHAGILKADGKIIHAPSVRADVPTFYEVYKDLRGKPPSGPMWEAWSAISLGMAKLNRTLVLPPGTPSDRVATLRKGIKRMAKDPRFVAEWEKIFGQKLAPLLVSPEEADRVKNKVMRPAPWQEFLRKFVWG